MESILTEHEDSNNNNAEDLVPQPRDERLPSIKQQQARANKLRDYLMRGWKGFEDAKELIKSDPKIIYVTCMIKANPWHKECPEKALNAFKYARYIRDDEMVELIIDSANMSNEDIADQLEELFTRQADPYDELDGGDSLDWVKLTQRMRGHFSAWALAPTWAIRVLSHIYDDRLSVDKIRDLEVSVARRQGSQWGDRRWLRSTVSQACTLIESHCIEAPAECRVQGVVITRRR